MIRAEGSVFCAGADMSEATERRHGGGRPHDRRAPAPHRRVAQARSSSACTAPYARAASGSSRPATSRSSAADATFALTEVRLGLAASVISLTVLPRMTQPRRQPHAAHGGDVRRRGGAGDGAGHHGRARGRPRRRARPGPHRPPQGAPAGAARGQGAAQPGPAGLPRGATATSGPRSPPASSAPTPPARRCSPSCPARSSPDFRGLVDAPRGSQPLLSVHNPALQAGAARMAP